MNEERPESGAAVSPAGVSAKRGPLILPIPPSDPREQRGFPVRYATLTERMLAAGVDLFVSSVALMPLAEGVAKWAGPDARLEGLRRRAEEIMLTAGDALSPEQQAEVSAAALEILRSQSPFALASTALMLGAILWCWRRWNATPGKVLFRQRIADAATGAPPTSRAYMIRVLGYIPSLIFLGAGLFWIAVDSRRRGWHDMMAGTVVLRINDKELLKHVA